MALQVIGAGFGRTGTSSLYTALNQLGFPCYHMVEVLDNPANRSHMDFWLKVANDPPGTQQNWESVFSGYRAAVDNPACCVWRELVAAYPEALVVLTKHPRGPEAWYRSSMATIYFTESLWQFGLLARIVPFARKMKQMSAKLIWGRSHRNTMADPDAAMARYEDHLQEVIEGVPAERLLVFSVDQGWEPLCRFLGVPVPDSPFPNVNDTAEFQGRKKMVRIAAYGMIALGALVLAGFGYGLYRVL